MASSKRLLYQNDDPEPLKSRSGRKVSKAPATALQDLPPQPDALNRSSEQLTAGQILGLQRTIGNRAVMEFLGKSAGTKLPRPAADQVVTRATDPGRRVQRQIFGTRAAMWKKVAGDIKAKDIERIIRADPALSAAYDDLKTKMPYMDFKHVAGKQPEADLSPNTAGIYAINYGKRKEQGGLYQDAVRYVGAILHEMMHITAALQFNTNVGPGALGHGANMHLPVGNGEIVDQEHGMTENQFTDQGTGLLAQQKTVNENWDKLYELSRTDIGDGTLTKAQAEVVSERIGYAQNIGAIAHYDTVLVDLIFYFVAHGLQTSKSYQYANAMLTEANSRRSSGIGAVQPIPVPT